MRSIQVYDKPMCCSTGICGTDVDSALVQFASDLEWLKGSGYQVERFNLAQQPTAFIENKLVHGLLSTEGTNCLPLVLIDGAIMSQKSYPTRESFSVWLGIDRTKSSLPLAKPSGGCCGPTGCC
ncbi:MAG: arsenite efflux transporter metallochaperone ArsD [Pirellula sp.]|jgi:arsenite methyltransferase